jgi:hypothetical protein
MAVNLHTHVVLRVLEVLGVLDVRLFQAYALNPSFLIHKLGSGIRGVVNHNSNRNVTVWGNNSDGMNSIYNPPRSNGRNPIFPSLRVG